MTSKERAALKAQANSLEPLFWLGKGGVSDALIAQINELFTARELIKGKVLLETAPDTPKNIANQIAESTGAEVVQVIGGAMIFYKYNSALHEGKSGQYEKPVTQKAIVKKAMPAPKKPGIANRPNSKKRKAVIVKKRSDAASPHNESRPFTLRDSKELKKKR